ncbi:hypothetical protein NQ317_016122 [Molorchus minor]|uniref:Uncharacterized protein n=1 Tax=Molorchus minor TaxID=1323400 RepID=A0ABQ9ITZ6_9CUCU|nr:hypothetical protein NQ317_016122 [Molorchus minor]
MSDVLMLRLEITIISICKRNGHAEAATALQNTYGEMKRCMHNKKIFITPKEEFLTSIEKCSEDALKITQDCLAENQKYFPEFVLDLAKSLTNFVYDDIDYMRYDLAPCVPRFDEYGVHRKYLQCLSDTVVDTDDVPYIQRSKSSFCK